MARCNVQTLPADEEEKGMIFPDLIDKLDKAMKHLAAAHYGYLVDDNGRTIPINGNQCRSEAGKALTLVNEVQWKLLEESCTQPIYQDQKDSSGSLFTRWK